MWRKTEAGIDNLEENEYHNIDSIEIDLQAELLVEIIKLAIEEANLKQ